LTFVDARTGKATVNNESWRRIFELANQIWSIPGNKPEKMNVGGHNPFVKDKNIGMIAAQNIFSLGLEDATKEGMNWDLAQYPSYKEKPNVYGYVDTHILTITKSSKVKDQALQVIGTVTSEEIQTLMARKTGRVTTLKNQEIKQQLGADMPFLKGKNIPAVFKSKPAAAPAVSEYNLKARALVMTAFDEYMAGKDINTTLREVDEKINRMVETETKK
jgi:multiple sugar transport system substrate-binding protein